MQTLAAYLKEAKITQKEFAERLRVREATVSGWVNGTIPRPTQMQSIAFATGGQVPVTVWFQTETGSAA